MTQTRFSQVSDFINDLLHQKALYKGEVINPPLVSIISSYYNAHSFFEQTFQTIMNQTLQNFEWIIVDDCSTNPKAITLFNSLESRSPKIKTFRHNTNKGPSAGRNTAISKATGKYLFFIDLDDLIDPTFIEKCVLFLELHPEFTFVSSYLVEFHNKESWYPYIGGERIPRQIEENYWSIMNMHRRVDFEKLGGFDEEIRCYEDWERWLKALVNGQKAWTIPEYLHCYRRLSSGLLSIGITAEGKEKNIENLIKNRYEKKFKANPPKVPFLERPTSYEVKNLRKKIQIENNLTNLHKNKNILFLFPHLEVGGADKFNLDLLEILEKKGYGLTIATTLKSSHLWHEHFYKITPDIFHLHNISNDTDWLSIIRYLIESRNIDVVFVSNSYFGYYMVPILRSLFPYVAFVDYCHSRALGWRVDGYARISRQLVEFFDAQIVSHASLADYNYENNLYSHEIPHIAYTNLDASKWVRDHTLGEEVRKHFNILPNETLIIFPARLEEEKRPELFVKIIHSLIKKSLPIKVVVLGKGNKQQEMEDLINHLGVSDFFHIAAPVSPEEMKKYYSAADIMLLPSRYEGVSLAIFESMAMEIVVVASKVGGHSELVIDGTGFLIEKGIGDKIEIDNYVKILEPLIKNSKLRTQIGKEANKRIIESFSLELLGKNIEEILESAIQKRNKRSQNEINIALAEELLILALENNFLESGWINLDKTIKYLQEKNNDANANHSTDLLIEMNQLLSERELLQLQKQLMEESTFWKVRDKWFKLKKKFGFSKNSY